jgi:hypothetical protein
LMILKVVIALATAAVGLVGLLRPTSLYAFTGLRAEGVRGISEIRSSLGGLFIGLGLAPLFLGPVAYQMLGIAYLALGAARLFSIVFDRSTEKSNLVSLASEIVFGILLIV